MKMAKKKIIQKSGKRKTSVARATIKKGSGIIKINNLSVEEYNNNLLLQIKLKEPLLISGLETKYDFYVKVFGGGFSSQIEAIRQAIARCIVEETKNEDIKELFLNYDRALLISDTRFKETKKPNSSKARAKRQKSYR